MNPMMLAPDALPFETPHPAPVKPKPRPKAKKKEATAVMPKANAATVRWSQFGVAFTLVLSAVLNGYANSQYAPLAFAGWLMGLSVPVIVLVLAKVAGEKWRDGNRTVAYLAAASGAALLFLSVYHCSNSIAALTGSSLFLAVPMSVAIDCGLVSLEIALVSEPRD